MIEKREENLKLFVPEPLSGIETAEIVSQAYEHVDPRIGSILVESNVVLTLAGARGFTEFYISDPIPEDFPQINSINKVLARKGMRMRPHDEIFAASSDGQQNRIVGVENLQGYEYSSRLSSIPEVIPFDASSGWAGLETWWGAVNDAIISVEDFGGLNISREHRTNILAALRYGYPDQAIFDYCDWLEGGRKKRKVRAEIPHAWIYKSAQPLFSYYPEHFDDYGICRTIEEWNKILGEFYNSPWHQNIKENPSFLSERKRLDI